MGRIVWGPLLLFAPKKAPSSGGSELPDRLGRWAPNSPAAPQDAARRWLRRLHGPSGVAATRVGGCSMGQLTLAVSRLNLRMGWEWSGVDFLGV